MVLVLSYGQCSQMVNIQSLTSIHADGHVVADEFLICRLDDWLWYYCQSLGYRVLSIHLDIWIEHLDINISPPQWPKLYASINLVQSNTFHTALTLTPVCIMLSAVVGLEPLHVK